MKRVGCVSYWNGKRNYLMLSFSCMCGRTSFWGQCFEEGRRWWHQWRTATCDRGIEKLVLKAVWQRGGRQSCGGRSSEGWCWGGLAEKIDVIDGEHKAQSITIRLCIDITEKAFDGNTGVVSRNRFLAFVLVWMKDSTNWKDRLCPLIFIICGVLWCC